MRKLKKENDFGNFNTRKKTEERKKPVKNEDFFFDKVKNEDLNLNKILSKKILINGGEKEIIMYVLLGFNISKASEV